MELHEWGALTGEPKLCPTSWAKVRVDTLGGTGSSVVDEGDYPSV